MLRLGVHKSGQTFERQFVASFPPREWERGAWLLLVNKSCEWPFWITFFPNLVRPEEKASYFNRFSFPLRGEQSTHLVKLPLNNSPDKFSLFNVGRELPPVKDVTKPDHIICVFLAARRAKNFPNSFPSKSFYNLCQLSWGCLK